MLIYLTEANKNNVDGKGKSIAQYLATFKQGDVTKMGNSTPIVIRVIGTVGSATWNLKKYSKGSSNLTEDKIVGINGEQLPKNSNTTQDELIKGGYNTLNYYPAKLGGDVKCDPINGLNSKCKYSSGEYDSCWNDCSVQNVKDITVEGVGEDAEIFQWGFTFKNCNSVEVRNLRFWDYTEDACSFEGSENSTTLEGFKHKYFWLYHNTFDIGINYWDVCPEQDKGDGDGSTDYKYLAYATLSYNRYNNTHKTGLIGGGDSARTACVTFHHNFYNSCDQRCPLGRQANMHMYNNYYKNYGLYAISVRAGAYVFVENCVFESNSKGNPPIELVKGSNGTPSCKVINSTMNKSIKNGVGTAYLYNGNDRSKQITCDNDYGNNFDTNAELFYYKNGQSDVTEMLATDKVKTEIPEVAGVMKHRSNINIGGSTGGEQGGEQGGETGGEQGEPTTQNPIGSISVAYTDLPEDFRQKAEVTYVDDNGSTKTTTVTISEPMQWGTSPVSIVVGDGNNGWTVNTSTYLQSGGTGTIEIDLTGYTGNAQITIIAKTTSAKNVGRYYMISGNGVTLYSAGYNDASKGISSSDQTDTFVLACGHKYTLTCSGGLRFKSFAFAASSSSPTATMPAP